MGKKKKEKERKLLGIPPFSGNCGGGWMDGIDGWADGMELKEMAIPQVQRAELGR